jgi:hypothetical protein
MPVDDRGGLQRQPQGLVDILDKILDKGLVICSIDKAEAIGINWWRSDRFYSSDPRAVHGTEEYEELRNRIADLEKQLNARELPQGKPGERKGR